MRPNHDLMLSVGKLLDKRHLLEKSNKDVTTIEAEIFALSKPLRLETRPDINSGYYKSNHYSDGIKPRKGKIDKDVLTDMYISGLSPKEITNHFKCTLNAVYRMIHNLELIKDVN